VGEWWQTPGVSEFVSAIAGAIIGALAGGLVSWRLQRASFAKDREDRAQEKARADRALLLQMLYACITAASDLHKLAEEAEAAKARAAELGFPKVPGLTNTWAGLLGLASLPEPITINPEGLTVLVDHKAADLLMGVLDTVAVHRSTIKLWTLFGDSRRRFGEKVPVKFSETGTYTALSQEEIERHYPHPVRTATVT